MERTVSERVFSGVAYAVTLAGLILVLVFVMGNEWAPRLVAVLGGASAVVVVLCWRGSRYTLAHAIHALFLSALTALLATVPLMVAAAVRHGYLLPRTVGVKDVWIDPVPYTLGAVCVFVGLPLLILTYEALADSLRGDFLEHWPPLRWLQDWLIHEKRPRRHGDTEI